MPSPLKGTGSLVNFETTYEIKKIEENTKAVIIEILWPFVFLFLINTNPVSSNKAVEPFKIA